MGKEAVKEMRREAEARLVMIMKGSELESRADTGIFSNVSFQASEDQRPSAIMMDSESPSDT